MARKPTILDQQFLSWFGEPALLPEEDLAKYNYLSEALAEEFEEIGILGTLFRNDLTMLFWDVRRLKEMKAVRTTSSTYKGLDRLLDVRGIDLPNRIRLKEGWARNDPKIKKEARSLLRQFGLNMSSVLAETVVVDLEIHGSLDSMIAKAEERRSKVLRDLLLCRDDLEARIERVERRTAAREQSGAQAPGPRKRVRPEDPPEGEA